MTVLGGETSREVLQLAELKGMVSGSDRVCILVRRCLRTLFSLIKREKKKRLSEDAEIR